MDAYDYEQTDREMTRRLEAKLYAGRVEPLEEREADHCPCFVPVDLADYYVCPIHVMCDAACGALKDPYSTAEMEKALTHWRDHGLLNGCSHGN